MNIVLNGIPDSKYEQFEAEFEKLELIDTKYFKLRDMNINFCQGCWDCWVKTPGVCVFKDDFVQILSMAPTADLLTVITPMILGYESALIKKFKDRFIPMVHPYVEIYKGEQHHKQRYKKNPNFRVIILEDEYTTMEDINHLRETYERVSLNLRFELIEVISIKKGEDFSHVITGI